MERREDGLAGEEAEEAVDLRSGFWWVLGWDAVVIGVPPEDARGWRYCMKDVRGVSRKMFLVAGH